MYEGEEIELQDKRAWKPGMWDDECEPADGAVSADQLAGRKKARAAKSLSNSRKVTKGPSVPQRRKSKRAAGLKTRSTTRSLTLQSLNAIL